MGNRGYVTLIKGEGQDGEMLFEANNDLPFFWLLGVIPEPLQAKVKETLSLEEPQKEAYPDNETYWEAYTSWFDQHELGEITLPIADYLENTRSHQAYISQHYPDMEAEYQECIEALAAAAQATPDGTIKVDYIEYTNFYETIQELYSEFDELITSIAADQPTEWVIDEDEDEDEDGDE